MNFCFKYIRYAHGFLGAKKNVSTKEKAEERKSVEKKTQNEHSNVFNVDRF